jgi:DNA repair exonuclease SbcCD ATPase subunit
LKKIVLFLLCYTLAFGEFQKVSIGNIDAHYKNRLSKNELYKIIKEIEQSLESQLGMDIFEYKEYGGKPIDIIYMPPSKQKRELSQKLQKLESLKTKMQQLQPVIKDKQDSVNSLVHHLNRKYGYLNQDIKELNRYISQTNKKKNLSKSEYEKIKKYVSKEQAKISKVKKDLDREKRAIGTKQNSVKNEIRKYNMIVSRYNRIQRQAENLSKGMLEVKGVTKSKTKTLYSSDGKEKSSKVYMEKIEIYDFEDLAHLKVILAHELAHLVGVDHVSSKGSLMNPVLQKEQVKNLSLSYDDIDAFYEAF